MIMLLMILLMSVVFVPIVAVLFIYTLSKIIYKEEGDNI